MYSKCPSFQMNDAVEQLRKNKVELKNKTNLLKETKATNLTLQKENKELKKQLCQAIKKYTKYQKNLKICKNVSLRCTDVINMVCLNSGKLCSGQSQDMNDTLIKHLNDIIDEVNFIKQSKLCHRDGDQPSMSDDITDDGTQPQNNRNERKTSYVREEDERVDLSLQDLKYEDTYNEEKNTQEIYLKHMNDELLLKLEGKDRIIKDQLMRQHHLEAQLKTMTGNINVVRKQLWNKIVEANQEG